MTTRLHSDFLTKPLAHRGLHDVTKGCPENSRAAIRAAIAAGYGIEIDLQLSADNRAMVFHDYALDRLAHDTGAVHQRTASELAQIQLRGGAEGIPDLAEVLALVAGQTPLLIEFKDQDGSMGPNVGPLEKAAAKVLQDYQGPVAVMGFNPHSVMALAELLPQVARGIVTSAYDPEDWHLTSEICDHLRVIPDYLRSQSSFISHEVEDLARPRVAELAGAGADILCWTVKSEAQEREARKVAANITFEGYAAKLKH